MTSPEFVRKTPGANVAAFVRSAASNFVGRTPGPKHLHDQHNLATGLSKYEDGIMDGSIDPEWKGYHPMQDVEIPLDEVDRAQGRKYRDE